MPAGRCIPSKSIKRISPLRKLKRPLAGLSRFQIKDEIKAVKKRLSQAYMETRRGADEEANEDSALIRDRN